MIKFKQKEYSGKGTQAIYKLKRQFKAEGGPRPKMRKFSLVQKEFGHVKGHGIKSLLVKGSKALDSIGNSEIAVQFRKGLAKSDVERHAIEQATNISKGASGQARRLRDSIRKVNIVRNFPQDVKHGVIEKAQQATNLAERFKYVPGSVIADVPQVVLDKGMVATATACLPIPGTTALAPATEKAARKFIPGYTKMSTKAAKKYEVSRVKRGLERTVNGMVGIA